MFFIVTGNGPSGAVSFTCETPVAAVEKALALSSDGIVDVLIADRDGLQYAPADFHRRFVESGP
jgi:hypothetical protein